MDRFIGKTVFALTGMSECGKSTVGRYFESLGYPRLKIGALFSRVKDKVAHGEELAVFVQESEKHDPYRLWDFFVDELLLMMEEMAVGTVSIESLYGGGLGPYLQKQLGKHFCLLFIDAPLDMRLDYQMTRENLVSIEEAKALLLPRDKIKQESGIPALREIADATIENTGTLDDLHQAVDAVIVRYAGV